jgi:hypothetical protein
MNLIKFIVKNQISVFSKAVRMHNEESVEILFLKSLFSEIRSEI